MTGLREFLLSFGAPGLFAMALLDSALIPLPGGVDLVLMLLSAMHPARLPFYMLTASVGSAVGCLMLHFLAGRGGDLVLTRFDSRKRQQVHDALSRYEWWAIFLAALLPPPFPTKLFILTAGVLHMDRVKLFSSVWLGRMVRYLLVGFLAIRYGERAGILLRHYSWRILLALLLLLAAVSMWVWVRHRRRTASTNLP
ncbi:MAG: VTT domain-containing protein [Acidobacteria bacterium]|nr:VTT domain-containing protein [Acidobacteriota bacterium]